MKNLILRIVTFTILMGIVALTINTAFGSETVLFLQKEQHFTLGNKWYIWKFNWWGYISNLQTSTTDTSILQLELPPRQWNSDIANNLGLIMDYLILIINILLYPLKLASYLVTNVLAIFGVNMDVTNNKNGLAWLVIFVRDMLSQIVVPYI